MAWIVKATTGGVSLYISGFEGTGLQDIEHAEKFEDIEDAKWAAQNVERDTKRAKDWYGFGTGKVTFEFLQV